MGVHDKDVYPQIKALLGIPEEEPIFILRGQDVCSTPTLLDYIKNVQRQGAFQSDADEDELHDLRAMFIEWQSANKVKVPD